MKNHLTEFKLNGKVKCITQTDYQIENFYGGTDHVLSSDRILSFIEAYHFNETGFKVSKKYRCRQDDHSSLNDYKYDDKGNLIEDICYIEDDNKKLYSTGKYTYIYMMITIMRLSITDTMQTVV